MQDLPLSIIQARRSSTRFPDKVFAKLGGKTVIQHVLDNTPDPKVLAVPLEEDWPDMGVPMVKGDMRPTMRFKQVLAAYPCEYFIRVCADSPFIRPVLFELLETGVVYCKIVGVYGWQLELCHTETFLEICDDNDEHVTKSISRFGLSRRIRPNLCVDYPEDIARLEKWL